MAVGRTISGDSIELDAFLGQFAGGVFGDEKLADDARRIAQRRRHRVPAIHDDGLIGVVAAQGLAPGALAALAAADLLMRGAGFGARTGAAGGGTWCHFGFPFSVSSLGGRSPSYGI